VRCFFDSFLLVLEGCRLVCAKGLTHLLYDPVDSIVYNDYASFCPCLQAPGATIRYWRKKEDIMTRTLPAIPNLEHLRKEAKALLRAFKNGDTAVCEILRYQYQFARASDETILKSEVSLQEIQHALALDYGFKSWSALTGHVKHFAQNSPQSHVDTDLAAKLVVDLIQNAHFVQATDIHLEWVNGRVVVRHRIAGRLQDVHAAFPDDLQDEILPCIKRMAGIDAENSESSQLGRFTIHVQGKELTVRASVVRYVDGESAALRLFVKGAGMPTLDRMGLSEVHIATLRRWEKCQDGLFVFSGPTGSGKTTTLYGVLSEMNSEELKIVTCEDYVEVELEGVHQMQVDPSRGVTFASGVHELLLQDPDVVMIGEIRDRETLTLSVNLTLTGHLVCSVMHADDAVQAVRRMLDLGVEPYLLKGKLIGVMAQRLVRRVCEGCKEEYAPENLPAQYAEFLQGVTLTKGRGCDLCSGTGYRGREGIYELLEVNDRLARMIGSGSDCDIAELRNQAIESGMIPMREDGLEKVRQGLTTLEEVLRVTADMQG
jgi:type IV pilus assembly protein PilB